MTVYKRSPRVDAQYYMSGSTARDVRMNQNAATQRRPAQQEPVTRRYEGSRTLAQPDVRTRRVGEQTQRRAPYAAPQTQTRPQQPLRDTRSRQERRRAEPARAYYTAQPEVQRMTRAEVNHRTVQLHAWQRAQEERRRREEEARIQAEEVAEQRRRAQQRVRAVAAFLVIACVITGALGIFDLLNRYIAIDKMTVTQRSLQAEIDDQQKRLEELQVEINKQSNIAQVQDYARDSLNMDYAQQDDIRVIALPGQP